MSRKRTTPPSAPAVVEAAPWAENSDGQPEVPSEGSDYVTTADDSHTPSEDELRAKIIYPFLLEKGFSPSDVRIEFAFPIRRGRQLQNRPRTDALVRKNGRAIFIIECKREDYELTDNDQAQTISYARLVQPEMPPYAVLTNGRRTILLDTFLGRPVEGEISVQDGVVTSPAAIEQAIKLRYLANKHLLCLSPDSLRAFLLEDLEEQIQIHSKGSLRPPYSPATHIPRTEIWNKIQSFSEHGSHRLLPLVGPATIGKTSEIFSYIQQTLSSPGSKALPLYIPLNLSGPDFLPFLAENFGWALNQSMSVVSLIHDLDEIAHSQGKLCIVYILDGADMAADNLAEVRKQIFNLIRRSSGLRCQHKILVAAQEATWMRLVSGQSVDLSAYCEQPVHVEVLAPEQSLRHIHALESFYGIHMVRDNLPGLPAITHMRAQQMRSAGPASVKASDVLGKYFRWQLSKVCNSSALLAALTRLSARLLDEDADRLEDVPTGADDAIASGFISRTEDKHGRESYAFTDDWIHYYVVGFHIWKLDRATPETVLELIDQAAERVEYARALDWLSSVMGDHEVWRLVAQRRPSHYFQCYRLATRFLRALSVGDEACLWMAPYKGLVSSPWCSIIDGEGVRWGNDPEIDSVGAPPNYEMRPDFSIFSRTPLVRIMARDAANTLKEIERWLPDRRETYRCSQRLWPVQHHVFERLRRKLEFRPYNLAEVARSLESPEYPGGVQMLQEILENALRLTHAIADAEFSGIQDLMPRKLRLEIEATPDAREYMIEYQFRSDDFQIEIVLGRYGELQRLSDDQRESSAGYSVSMGELPLYRMLVAPYRMFPFPDPRLTWSHFKRTNGLRKVNAVGNVAARWLAEGISSAVSSRLKNGAVIDERLISRLDHEGVIDPAEGGPLSVVESVLNSFKHQGRIQLWQRAGTGFIVDSFYGKRPPRPGEIGFRIDARVHRAGFVNLSIKSVSLRTAPDSQSSVDDHDDSSLVVGNHGLPEAVERLLNIFVGFPPEGEPRAR